MPSDFAQYRLAREMGVPPWVFEGYPLDEPPLQWVIRCFEFSAMENSVRVTRQTRPS